MEFTYNTHKFTLQIVNQGNQQMSIAALITLIVLMSQFIIQYIGIFGIKNPNPLTQIILLKWNYMKMGENHWLKNTKNKPKMDQKQTFFFLGLTLETSNGVWKVGLSNPT